MWTPKPQTLFQYQQNPLFLNQDYPLPIRRARKIFLYTYDQEKYFDFSLLDGEFILGYDYHPLRLKFKNILSRGFMHHFPSHWHGKCKKMIFQYLQKYHFPSLHHKNQISFLWKTQGDSTQTRLSIRDFRFPQIHRQEPQKISFPLCLDLEPTLGLPLMINIQSQLPPPGEDHLLPLWVYTHIYILFQTLDQLSSGLEKEFEKKIPSTHAWEYQKGGRLLSPPFSCAEEKQAWLLFALEHFILLPGWNHLVTGKSLEQDAFSPNIIAYLSIQTEKEHIEYLERVWKKFLSQTHTNLLELQPKTPS